MLCWRQAEEYALVPSTQDADRRIRLRRQDSHLRDAGAWHPSGTRDRDSECQARETLQAKILENVGFGSTVYTDGWSGYDGLSGKQFIHETVNHMDEYVRDQVSTQAIENFWSCLKRTLSGTYVAVEPYHIDRYLDEQMFRFNNRIGHTDGTRFQKALAQVGGKRLTWVELTGKEAPKAV